MKIEKIVIKVSRVYYTDCGTFLRVIEDDGNPPYWYIQDIDGNWVLVDNDAIERIEEAEYEYDLKIK